MAISRVKHWATQSYHHFLLDRARTPFAWGSHDCALFAADAVKAISGVDIADDFRGKYSTEDEAYALIQSVTGGTSVGDAAAHCAAKHGLAEHKHPLMAKRGDLVVLENDGRLIAGVIHLNGRHITVAGEQGLKRFSISLVKRAWGY